jgi:hypothetical protein
MRVLAIGLVSLALILLGFRLLRLARLTRASPERWLGLAFLCAGASAWMLPVAALEGIGPERARLFALSAQCGMTGATAFLVVFAWRVFRADSRVAGSAAIGLITANVAAGAAVVASGSPVPVGALGLLVILARSAALLWLFFESALYAQRMRRRLRLGLADAIVANRFVLWSIWTGALAVVPLFVLALRATGALEAPVHGAPLPAGIRAALAMVGLGGAAAVVAGGLAFFPPASYQRWIARRASVTA